MRITKTVLVAVEETAIDGSNRRLKMARNVKNAIVEEQKEKKQENITLVRSQSSVMIKRDAKGIFQFEVKSYADTLEEAQGKAESVVNSLCAFVERLNGD
jgi:hypothetical protein